jgi:phosphate transport system substrate-binding protein
LKIAYLPSLFFAPVLKISFTSLAIAVDIGEIIRKLITILVIALFIGSIIPALAQEKVTVSGSTTVLPLGEAAAEVFNSEQKEYQASVTGGGTGAGITGIAEGRFDIAMASRAVTSDEVAKYGNKFQENLVGYDGIVMIVSKPIYDAGVVDLSTEQIKEIYSGKIDNWKAVGGPDEEIFVVAREQGSGTRDTFNEDIMGNKSAETPGVDAVTLGSAEAKTAVAGNDRGIGYVGYSYAEGGNVEAVALDGVMPSVETIKSGTYGLSRDLYFYTYGDPKPGAKAFTDFVLSPEGQMIAQENGFIPITEITEATPEVEQAKQGEEAPAQPAQSQPGFEALLGLVSLMAVSYLAIGRRN